MKLKQKMADDNACGWFNEFAAADFYLEGFEAAKELILLSISKLNDPTNAFNDAINQAGEDETN